MSPRIIGLLVGRAGSKGVKNKNIRALAGKPLVTYTIEAALSSRRLTEMVVSTDSSQLRTIAQEYGLGSQDLRPSALAQDSTSDAEVIAHALSEYIKPDAAEDGLIVYLRPTTPFKTGALIDECIDRMLEDKSSPALRTITRVHGAFHPAWQYVKMGGQFAPLSGYGARPSRRQDLSEVYRVNGVVDIVRFTGQKVPDDMFWSAKKFVEVDEYVSADIDTEFDFDICEMIIKKRKGA